MHNKDETLIKTSKPLNLAARHQHLFHSFPTIAQQKKKTRIERHERGESVGQSVKLSAYLVEEEYLVTAYKE